MKKMASGEAKNRFGELLDAAQHEPVTIEKHGRPVAVMVSVQDFDDIEAMKLELLRAKVRRGVADAEAGRVTDGEAVFAELEAMIDRAEG